jgi:glycosyltransferase involved in cell wall biosynthesis
VRHRIQAVSRHAQVKVLSPVGVLDYTHPSGDLFGNCKLPPRLLDGGVEVFYPRWIYPPGGGAVNARLMALELLPRLKRLRREYSFDLIDAHFGYPDGIAAAALAGALGIPYAVTLRGNETMHGERRSIRQALSRALRGAVRIIVLSRALGEFAVCLGAEPERVKLIPNGLDSSVFYPRDRAAVRRELGLADNVRVVLSAGSLIERKGHHTVARVLAAVRRRCGPVELLIAGGPGREGRFERQIAEAIRACGMARSVRMLGQVSAGRLAELMSAADVFCLASSREGWPNVVHEAMACGTPVVATAVGSVPDMIPSKQYGLVTPPGDEEAIGQALAEALETRWDQQAIAAWARSRDWDQVAREVLQELTDGLRGN